MTGVFVNIYIILIDLLNYLPSANDFIETDFLDFLYNVTFLVDDYEAKFHSMELLDKLYKNSNEKGNHALDQHFTILFTNSHFKEVFFENILSKVTLERPQMAENNLFIQFISLIQSIIIKNDVLNYSMVKPAK